MTVGKSSHKKTKPGLTSSWGTRPQPNWRIPIAVTTQQKQEQIKQQQLGFPNGTLAKGPLRK
jgi:subtilisin-like proprotein convertase family protein